MRSKALLVGAQAGFVGPWVNIEEGMWVVGPPSSVSLEIKDVGTWNDGRPVAFYGPNLIRAIVARDYDGEDVFLKIRQDNG